MIWFAAEILGRPLDPWQQWLVIHIGELLEDGRPRFRQVLVIVARQNGKTWVCQVLALFWMFVERQPFVFGTSTTLEQAKKAWTGAVELAEKTGALQAKLNAKHKRIGNGQQDFWTVDGSHYMIGAADRKGGRGDAIDRAIGDELREQQSWDAYLAAYNAMNARPAAQVVYITNMGDAKSIVLNSLRRDALAEMNSVQRPIGLFEWSAPPGSHPTDMHAHAAANPQYGRRNDRDTIISEARKVARPGADPQKLTGFLTEILCLSVDQLDPAIDPAGWATCRRPAPIDLGMRARLAACIDVAPDQQHATLAAAIMLPAGQARVETVASWDGPDAMARLMLELPGWVRRVRPKLLGWFPGGPGATLDAALRDRRKSGGRAWPPRGTTVEELQSETAAVCMAFAGLVAATGVLHSGQPDLDAQVAGAEKLWTGDRWVFVRRRTARPDPAVDPAAAELTGHADAVYAAAGAVHLARTMPAPRPTVRRAYVGPVG